MSTFIPDYLNIDFSTFIQKLRDELSESPIFKDYDYEGSNISILIELMAYYGDLNTFFMNKIAKNVYMETVDVYENANRLARQQGYEPKGVRSARGTLTVTVSGCTGESLKVKAWKQLDSSRSNIETGEAILYATTSSVEVSCSGSLTTISVPIRQGRIVEITNYTSEDIIQNELLLPENYAYDDDLSDSLPSMRMIITNEEWLRVADFYDDLIPLISDDVFMMVYDRYERTKILFNVSRNVPTDEDTIDVTLLDSFGPDGSVLADEEGDTWTILDEDFMVEIDGLGNETNVPTDQITISLSAGTIGASNPETIDEIRINSASALRAQFRNVTRVDYDAHLSSRSDIIRATAWGEQQTAPSGSIELYNMVKISVIPLNWETSTISTSSGIITTDWGVSGSTIIPQTYSSDWTTELLDYMQPRKMISAYEVFIIPELVYFTFDIGLRIKRTYDFNDVKNDTLAKLVYYFRPQNQSFNSIVNFNDIIEYVMDPTQVSDDSDFENIKGIRNFNLRDINSNFFIYEPNDINNYPYWVQPSSVMATRDNRLRKVQLGMKQFPYLSSDTVKITQET